MIAQKFRIACTKQATKALGNVIFRHRQKLAQASPKVQGPSVASVLHSVKQWSSIGDSVSATDLILVGRHTLDRNEGYIPFSCHLFLSVAERYMDSILCIGTDAKMGVISNGWGVAAIGVLIKDGLRNTTIGRCADTTKVQMEAATTTFLPYMFALMHEESGPNFDKFFADFIRLWDSYHYQPQPNHLPNTTKQSNLPPPHHQPTTPTNTTQPPRNTKPTKPKDRRSAAVGVRQLHKDYAPGIEQARRQNFSKSRPANDYPHLVRNLYTEVQKNLKHNEISSSLGKTVTVKRYLDITMRMYDLLRLLPAIDLYSVIWQSWLNTVEHDWQEDTRRYLENPSKEYTAQEIRNVFNIPTDVGDDEKLYFAFHWIGLTGIHPGSGSGSQSAEAFNSGFEREVQWGIVKHNILRRQHARSVMYQSSEISEYTC